MPLPPWLAALALAAAPPIDLDFSHGVLGADLRFTVQGTPGALALLSVALTPGPTPLPCGPVPSLEQDFSTSVLFTALPLDAGGTGLYVQSLPTSPGLAGLDLYAQSVEFDPLSLCPIAAVSNPLRFSLVPLAVATIGIGSMHQARIEHSFTILPDGTGLLAGGKSPDPNNPTLVSSLEIYDPRREEFHLLTTTLTTARAHHQAVALNDGRVLILGGVGAGGQVLASVEGFLRQPRTVTTLAPMSRPRVFHTATLLPDGRVLVLGGLAGQFKLENKFGFPQSFFGPGGQGPLLSEAPEIFDPTSNTWSPVPIQGLLARAGHQATRLKDGRVLITGGLVYDSQGNRLVTTPRVEVLDPSTWSLAALQEPLMARAFHASVPKVQGGALFAGGGDVIYTPAGIAIDVQNAPPMSYYAPTGVALGSFQAAPPLPDPAPLRILLCVPQNSPTAKYLVVPCPDPPPPVGAPPPPSHAGVVYLYDEIINVWNPIGTTTLYRPGHRALHFEDQARTAFTGSAWPTPVGSPGPFDLTHEVFAPLP